MQILFFEDVRIMRLCVCLYSCANTAGSFWGGIGCTIALLVLAVGVINDSGTEDVV